MAEREETLVSQLMPVLLGLITDSILDSISDLGLMQRVLTITGIGIIYGLLYVKRKRSKKNKYEQKKLEVPANPGNPTNPKDTVSRRVTAALIVGFLIAIILVGAASLILGLPHGMIIQLMGWLLLMVIFVLSGDFLPSRKMALFLRAIAAVSLGGALSIGGVPTYEFVTAEPVELTIQNYCSDTIVYDLLDIEVLGNTVETVKLKPVTVTFTRDENFVYVYAFCRKVPYSVPEDALVSFNGQEIGVGDSLTIDLSEQEQHTLIIQCKS